MAREPDEASGCSTEMFLWYTAGQRSWGQRNLTFSHVIAIFLSTFVCTAASVLFFLMLDTLSLLFSPGPHLAQSPPFKAHQRVVSCYLSKLTLMTPPHELVSQLFLLPFCFSFGAEPQGLHSLSFPSEKSLFLVSVPCCWHWHLFQPLPGLNTLTHFPSAPLHTAGPSSWHQSCWTSLRRGELLVFSG